MLYTKDQESKGRSFLNTGNNSLKFLKYVEELGGWWKRGEILIIHSWKIVDNP